MLPDLRGRLLPNEPLAPLTWFRVGGPAQALFMPEDEDDLAYALAGIPADVPVTVVGLGSNLIVRDGGVPGVVVRLGRGFNDVVVEGTQVHAGAAVPDVKVARAAQDASLAGLAFYRGIPGAIGGALRMNGGAYGRETKDALVSVRAVDRTGRVHVLSNADMRYTYRHSGAPADLIFTRATFQGAPGDRDAIAAEMEKITEFAGGDPADQEPHRRLDLQEPAGPKGLATDRCRRLPRTDRRSGAGLGDALQFPDQPRRRDGGRYRNARRNRSPARSRHLRHRTGVGDQAHRRRLTLRGWARSARPCAGLCFVPIRPCLSRSCVF